MYLYLGGGTWGHRRDGGRVMIAHPRRPTYALEAADVSV
jgi:hypothetical protein